MTQTPSTPPAGGTGDPQPPAGTTTTTDPQAGESQKATKSAEDYERMLAELRRENAGHRTKLKKFEEDEAARTTAQMTETEKLQKELKDLQSAREADIEHLIGAEIRMKAAEMGVAPQYLKRVATMLDWEELDIDEKTGMPTNVDKVLATLLKEMPFLAGKSSAATGGATNPSRTAASQVGEITRDTLTEAMARYNELSPAQKEQVHQLLITRI